MKRVALGLAGAAVGLAALLAQADRAAAQSVAGARAQRNATALDVSAQRRRAPTRLRVYREGYLPPTAQRSCQAWYEQEYRPSGTVIAPRMRCRWVNG